MGFPARYPGKCTKCGAAIGKGDMISWSRKPGQKGVYHMACGATAPAETEVCETELTETEEQELTTANANLETNPTVENALKVLLGALGPKPTPTPAIDLEEVRRIVRETITEEGTLKIEITQRDTPPVTVENAHCKLPVLLDLVGRRKHVYVFGPHGSGKSTAAHQVATALNYEYGYISLSPQTPESRLIGYKDATGVYQRTVFRERYEYGGVFCVDEADNGSPSLLTTLNGGLENGHMAFPDAIVPRHDNFVLVATGNTSGKGANPSYPERRPFDAAFADRFVFLEWGYDEKLEKKITLAMNPEAGKWVSWVREVRKWAAKNHPRFVPSPRATFRLAELSIGSVMSQNELLDAVLWRGDTELASKVLANCPIAAEEA